MRKFLLLRGLPGSGKSHFVSENKLEPYTLSADGLRMLYGSPNLEANGKMRIPATNDRIVWQQLLQLLENRMFRGELVIVDATHTHPRSFSNYQQLANKHRYQVICVDFSDVAFDVCNERNNKREEYKVVPPLEMKRMSENMTKTRMPQWITTIQPSEMTSFLNIEPKDVSDYTAIHHIGDLQGCYTPLQEYFNTYGIHDDELYVFVGDYLDRGTENVQVMQWLLENYHRPNFIFIGGNHEAHLRNWTRGVKARSAQFNQATAPELDAANIPPKKVHGFLYQLREMFYYTFYGRTVLVTHGGLSTLPKQLSYINAIQFIKGAGSYEEADVCDASFAANTPDNVYQVHGHRNRYSSSTRSSERCFNLEGKIEFGGELRTVTLAKEGFEERPIKSNIDATHLIVEPVGDLPGETGDVTILVKQLRFNKDIYEKAQAGTNISSFNFSRDVFYKKTWDSFNVHARGLFINTANNTIVARSYEKFFNVGERPETQRDTLAQTFAFPVRAWVKENGYLGLVGYDSGTDDLVFASKSSMSSDFAKWLRQQFDELASPNSKLRNDIMLYLKSDGGKTLVFEAIEPMNDPHIIHYDSKALILLDIVNNNVTFSAADRKECHRIAKMLNCKTKMQAAVLKDSETLQNWLNAVQHFDYLYNGSRVEGFVLEDARGLMVKVKLPWYAFWRQMRTQLERLQSGKKAQMPALEINRELAKAFIDFLGNKSAEDLKSANIIDLRNEFNE